MFADQDVSLVLSQGARYGVPWRERLQAAFSGLSVSSVVADGRLVAVGRVPTVDEVIAVLREAESPRSPAVRAEA